MSKRLLRTFSGLPLAAGLLLAVTQTACDDAGPEIPDYSDRTVGEIVDAEAGSLSVLATALEQAGLRTSLDGAGPITLFAPANAAFDAIDTDALLSPGNEALLTEILEYHVVPDAAIESGGISGAQTVTTLEGTSLELTTDGGFTVNGVPVSRADLVGLNGVVHIIDGVLLGTTRGIERIQLTADYSLMETALERAGLVPTLASGTYTIFVPTNAAFLAALDADASGAIEEGEFPAAAALEDILLYHVVPGTVPSGIIDDNAAATTLEGSLLIFGVEPDGTITINPTTDSATVTAADLRAENGVIHEIDTVLVP